MSTDISELFARDPMGLSTQDLDAIIARYREAQSQFALGAKQAGNTKKVAKPDAKIASIDLGALGLGPKK